MVWLAAGLEHGQVYANVGGINISDPDCNISRCYVLIRIFFSGILHSRDLHKEEETMVFEAHGNMSFPCTELLLFNYAKVNTVFHSMAPLTISSLRVTFIALCCLRPE